MRLEQKASKFVLCAVAMGFIAATSLVYGAGDDPVPSDYYGWGSGKISWAEMELKMASAFVEKKVSAGERQEESKDEVLATPTVSSSTDVAASSVSDRVMKATKAPEVAVKKATKAPEPVVKKATAAPETIVAKAAEAPETALGKASIVPEVVVDSTEPAVDVEANKGAEKEEAKVAKAPEEDKTEIVETKADDDLETEEKSDDETLDVAALTTPTSVPLSAVLPPYELPTAEASVPKAEHVEPAAKPGKKPKKEFVSWKQRYELGPGDILTFSFAGRPELLREAVKISPEGTVSYLQAIQIRAEGRTVDELRDAINSALVEYHEDPRAIVIPIAVGSKRYTIMGQVRQSGTFPLDRPMNLLEAISKSQGIQVGVSAAETVELADFDRSFLVRGGKKMPVDFSKLYLDGDLSHNAALEPNDYIYIASNLRNEFYLVGAVKRQGAQALTSRLTVTGAVASASGFHDKAWRGRVLLIRGSINNPESQVINVSDILRGKQKDIFIQPKDIIYVHYRPWAFVEDILDTAIRDFLSAVSSAAVN